MKFRKKWAYLIKQIQKFENPWTRQLKTEFDGICVIFSGPELEEQKLLILRKEIQIHCATDLTHEADQLKLQRCLRDQLKTSAEAAIILEQCRALQGIPKTERELKAERGKVWSRLFFSSLLLSLLFNAIDTGSDILIMIRYGLWQE